MYLPLENGAQVILEATKPDGDTIVLALTDRDYVTWCVDSSRHCYSGDYYSLTPDGLQMALSAYRVRAGV